jgi:16S rRNA (uracil1498-N3)-methyltransferase
VTSLVRIYIPRERLVGGEVELLPEESGYLARVRRMEAGDALEVFDGQGSCWQAVLNRGRTQLALGQKRAARSHQRFTFELWQGLAKADRMEWVIQKATELGVARIVPLASERSVVKLPPARAASKLLRWRKIAQEAARQSGRSDVPEVSEVSTLAALLRLPEQGISVALAYEREQQQGLGGFLQGIADGSRIALAVGPEGGFEPDEIERVHAAGIPSVGLGDRVLRTETAAVAVCVLALAAAGGMSPREP